MLKPSIELTRNQAVSDYSLVVGIAKRAREIASDAETKGEILEEKTVDLAVQEYIQRKFEILEPTVCEVCGRIDCICEKPSEEAALAETEEVPVQPVEAQDAGADEEDGSEQ